MKVALAAILIVLLGIALAQILLARRFQAEVTRQEQIVQSAPVPEARDPAELPDVVQRFAERGLAGQGGLPRAVRLTQDVEILRGDTWSRATARQHIAIAEPGFTWVADGSGWPFPSVRVIDRFTNGEGLLEVRLLGSLCVGGFDGPDADFGEAMRFVAELPLVPDAILANRSITWRALAVDVVEAELPISPRPVVVRFRFDEAGDVVEITAEGRPDVSSSTPVLRDWRGVFSEYGEIGGRRIPRFAEIGYVIDGVYAPYFRGRITSYERLP